MPGKHKVGYDQEYYQRNKERLSANQKIRRAELRAKNPFIGNLRTTKANSRKLGLPFDLLPEEIEVPEYCPYLNIKLEWGKGIQDGTPSIDRIVPSDGYVKTNIQIISHLANAMKNKATVEQMITFAENVLKLHKKC